MKKYFTGPVLSFILISIISAVFLPVELCYPACSKNVTGGALKVFGISFFRVQKSTGTFSSEQAMNEVDQISARQPIPGRAFFFVDDFLPLDSLQRVQHLVERYLRKGKLANMRSKTSCDTPATWISV